MSTKEEVLSRLARNTSVQTDSDGGILIGDKYINSYVDMNNPDTPAKEDYLLIIKVPSDGSAKKYVKYTVSELITALGKEATDAMNAAIEANTNAQAAYSAIQLIQAEVNNAVQGFDDTVNEAKTDAVSEITTAKDNAKTEISNSKESALDAIGESDTEGARGDAISSIAEKKSEALSELSSKMRVGYRTVIGDGTTKVFDIHHNMDCEWTLYSLAFSNIGKASYYQAWDTDRNTLHIEFDFAPEADSVEVKIIPNIRIETGAITPGSEIGMENLPSEMYCTEEQISNLLSILD